MISILPLRDRALLQKLNETEHTDCSHAYCLYDGGKVTAYLLYDMHEKEAFLAKLGGQWDDNIADGLCRAVFSPAIDRSLTRRLGFTKGESDTVESIRSILYHCQSCGCAK